jgi:hypothetical protein
VLAAIVAATGIVVASAPAGAAKPTITATGNVSCTLVGKVKFNPVLSTSFVASSTVTGKLKGPCTGSTEQGVTPVKAKVTMVGSVLPGTCVGALNSPWAGVQLSVRWKGEGGKINPTNVSVIGGMQQSGNGWANSDSVTTGSYFGGANAALQLNSASGINDLVAGTCVPNEKGKVKGVKKMTLEPSPLTIS